MFCQRVMIVYYIFLSFMFLCVSCGEISPEAGKQDKEPNKESKHAQPNAPVNNPAVSSADSLEGASEGNLSPHLPAAAVDSPSGTPLPEPPALNNPAGVVFSPNGAILPSSNGTTSASVDTTTHLSPVDSTTTEASKEQQSPANPTSVSPSVTVTTATHSDPSTTQNPPKGSAAISSAAISLIILGSTIASIL